MEKRHLVFEVTFLTLLKYESWLPYSFNSALTYNHLTDIWHTQTQCVNPFVAGKYSLWILFLEKS